MKPALPKPLATAAMLACLGLAYPPPGARGESSGKPEPMQSQLAMPRPNPLQSVFHEPAFSPHEQSLLGKLEAEINALPDGKRSDPATRRIEVLLASDLSDPVKAKLLVGLAKLLGEEKHPQRGGAYLKRAFNAYPNTGTGMFALDRYLDQLQSEGKFQDAVRTLTEFLNVHQISRDRVIYADGRLAFFLAASGAINEGLGLLKELSRRYPERESVIGAELEDLGSNAMSIGRFDVYYETMKWIDTNLKGYAADPRFRGNFAHACQTAKHDDEAIAILEGLVARPSKDPRLANFLFELGNLYKKRAEPAKAATYYRRLATLRTDDEYASRLKKLADMNLHDVDPAASRGPRAGWRGGWRDPRSRWFLAANLGFVFLLIATLTVVVVRRRHGAPSGFGDDSGGPLSTEGFR